MAGIGLVGGGSQPVWALHAAEADLEAGEVRSNVIGMNRYTPSLLTVRPGARGGGEVVGSGKSLMPWTRMHLENARNLPRISAEDPDALGAPPPPGF